MSDSIPAPSRGALPAFAIEDDRALAALVNLIAVLADGEYFYGKRISEWSMGAPSLELGVACAAIAQEKLGHARALYPLLEELPWPNAPGVLEREGDRARHYCVSFLDAPFPGWDYVVAAFALVGPAQAVVFEALAASAYEAPARTIRRIVEEERLNAGLAGGLVRDLVAAPPGVALLQARVDEVLPEMLCWFGPRGEPGVEALTRARILAMDNETMRQTYLDRVAPPLLDAGLRLPVRRAAGGGAWEYGELPWNRWNGLQRRFGPSATTGQTTTGA